MYAIYYTDGEESLVFPSVNVVTSLKSKLALLYIYMLNVHVGVSPSLVEKQKLTMREVGSRGLDLTQQPIVLLFVFIICQKRRVKKA